MLEKARLLWVGAIEPRRIGRRRWLRILEARRRRRRQQLFESTERPTLVSALTLDAENIYWAVTNAPGVGGAVWSMRKNRGSGGRLEPTSVN